MIPSEYLNRFSIFIDDSVTAAVCKQCAQPYRFTKATIETIVTELASHNCVGVGGRWSVVGGQAAVLAAVGYEPAPSESDLSEWDPALADTVDSAAFSTWFPTAEDWGDCEYGCAVHYRVRWRARLADLPAGFGRCLGDPRLVDRWVEYLNADRELAHLIHWRESSADPRTAEPPAAVCSLPAAAGGAK